MFVFDIIVVIGKFKRIDWNLKISSWILMIKEMLELLVGNWEMNESFSV